MNLTTKQKEKINGNFTKKEFFKEVATQLTELYCKEYTYIDGIVDGKETLVFSSIANRYYLDKLEELEFMYNVATQLNTKQ